MTVYQTIDNLNRVTMHKRYPWVCGRGNVNGYVMGKPNLAVFKHKFCRFCDEVTLQSVRDEDET